MRRFSRSDVLERTRSGIVVGLVMASLYVLYVLALYVLEGPGPFDRVGASLGSLCAAYLASGIVGGALVGILRPLTRHWLGFAAVGLLVAFVAVCAVAMSMLGLITHWTRDDWETCIGTALLLGVPGSASFRWIFRSPEK